MSKVLTSIGVKFYIGYSNYNEPRPNWSEYIRIPQVVESSDFDLSPEAISTRSMNNLRYRSYMPDKVDTGGVQSLTVNSTIGENAESIWNYMSDKFEEGYCVWLCISIPLMKENTFIPICPISTSAANTPLNDRITRKLFYTIVGDIEFEDVVEPPLWTNNAWNFLPHFNEGNQLTQESEIDVSDVNKLFNNVFYLKGN